MRCAPVVFVLFLAASPLFAEFPKEITVGDKTYPVRTVEEMRKLGFECEDIPWKDNAARLYIEAMTACRPLAKSIREDKRFVEAFRTLDLSNFDEPGSAWIEDNHRTLDLIAQADRMPRCEFPTIRSGQMASMTHDHVDGVDQLTWLLALRAVDRFGKGDHAEAIDDCTILLRLGKRVACRAEMLTWMVGTNIRCGSAELLDRMTVSGKLTDRSLADIARRLEEFRPRLDGYADSLHRSGVYLRLYAEGLYEPFEPLVAHLGLWERICWRLQRRTAVMNQEALFTFLETQARMPACEAVRRENSFAVHGPGNPVRYGHVDKESAEGWQTALSAAVRSQAVFDLVALRVALCRYRLAKKRYPQTLEELVPTYLEKAPVDPFSGKLYRYRSADQGFLAWSIAGDLVDNSGKCEAPYEPDLRITEDKGPGESD